MSALINLSIFLRNRNFTCLYIGQFVSFFGTMITGVALPYQIYTMTHSTLMVGLLSAAQLLPILLTALIGGVFADRYHRRALLLISEGFLSVGALMLALNAAHIEPSISLIFLTAMLMSALTGLHRPALDSIVQQVVEKKDLPAVGSLATFKFSVAMILGPAIGGIIIAHQGIMVTYLVDCATFVISFIAILLMSDVPKPLQTTKDISTFNAILDGFKYAISRQELVGTYLVDFLAMIFGMPNALFPAIALSFGGPEKLGLMYSAPAIGALFISIFSGWTEGIKRHGAAVAIAAIFWGFAIVGFGIATYYTAFYLSLLFLAFAGLFDAVSGIFRMVMWNETIPQQMRGRLAGIEMISYLSGPRLGDTEAGLVAALFGVTFSVISGGVLCIVGVSICCFYLPKFWVYRAE